MAVNCDNSFPSYDSSELRFPLFTGPMVLSKDLSEHIQMQEIRFRRIEAMGIRLFDCMSCRMANLVWVGGEKDIRTHVEVHSDMMRWASMFMRDQIKDYKTLRATDVWEVDAELKRAKVHGEKFVSLHEAYAVTLEELQEVWAVTMQKKKARNREALRKEWIQLAAMAHKALASMDNFVGGDV